MESDGDEELLLAGELVLADDAELLEEELLEEELLDEEALSDDDELLALSSSEKSMSSLGVDSLGCAVSGSPSSPSFSLGSSQGEPSPASLISPELVSLSSPEFSCEALSLRLS